MLPKLLAIKEFLQWNISAAYDVQIGIEAYTWVQLTVDLADIVQGLATVHRSPRVVLVGALVAQAHGSASQVGVVGWLESGVRLGPVGVRDVLV